MLLLKTADRRAHSWLVLPTDAQDRHPPRLAHYRLNRDELVRAMAKAEKKLDEEFLGRKTVDVLSPWGAVRTR